MTTGIITGTVEKLVAGGHGLIRSPRGIVFCRAVLPGETVTVRILRDERGVKWGEPVEVVAPSPDRVPSPCPFFPACGGCALQHAAPAAEPALAGAILTDTIARLFKRELPLATLVAGPGPHPESGYRHHVRLQVRDGKVGFFKPESNDLIPIDDCLIAHPRLREEIRRLAREGYPHPAMSTDGQVSSQEQEVPERRPKTLTLRVGYPDPGEPMLVRTCNRKASASGCPALAMTLAGHRFQVSPESFFQVNPAVAERLLTDLVAAIPGGDTLHDLFAGVGTFALPLASKFAKVRGYELVGSSLADFKANAAGMASVTVAAWDALRGFAEPVGKDDVVILDPPRTGLPKKVRMDLVKLRPKLLAYVSCDPPTLLRDLAAFLTGGWELTGPLRPYAMFPRTAHLETVALLKPV